MGGLTYVGLCTRAVKERAGEHFGSTVWPSQENTDRPVGVHFRLPGHVPRRHFDFLPIEKVNSRDPFIQLVRESFWIRKLGTLCLDKKNNEIEFGLNLEP